MNTLKLFSQSPKPVPASTLWYIAELSEAKGRQELFTKQSPQRLKTLREHAIVESAVSSNRIEGVEIHRNRVATVVFGRQLLRDRDEEEVRGYRDALNIIHTQGAKLPISERTIRKLHRIARANVWDAGKYKEKDSDIIEKYPDGKIRIRFKPVSAKATPEFMSKLILHWQECIKQKSVHPLIVLAAINLDFLCIHPFRDGNGRVSRLLFLQCCYHLGYDVGRFISIERLIEQNKERYYETLEQSSHRWHEGKHDPWSYINFLLYILKCGYKEFEERIGKTKVVRGAKTDIIHSAIQKMAGTFSVSDLQRECPGVSIDMIRKILSALHAEGHVECLGRGIHARWQKLKKWK